MPALFAVADDDEFPPSVQTIEWLYNLDSNPGKRFLHYAFGGHGADMFPYHPELPRTIVQWYLTELIQSGDIKEAVEVLKLNATAFPGSPNVYDSLADAYLADGAKELARQNAKKCLELLASDTLDPPARRDGIKASATEKLKQLGEP